MRPRYYIPIGILIVFLIVAAVYVVSAGPYKGRLLDKTTGRPVSGAVVVGYWAFKSINVGGGTTYCLDARETVTDERGEFTIPVSAFGELFGSMYFAIYKVGYARIGPGPWISLSSSDYFKDIVTWEGDRAIIPLKRVAKERLRYEGSPPSGGCGRRNGKPLSAYLEEERCWEQAMGLTE
jgi:hypothetical protein